MTGVTYFDHGDPAFEKAVDMLDRGWFACFASEPNQLIHFREGSPRRQKYSWNVISNDAQTKTTDKRTNEAGQ